METTDMQAIRDALNNAKIDNGDRVREADYRMRKFYEQREAECINALAILDKIDKSGEGVRGTGMVITDGEIERKAQSFADARNDPGSEINRECFRGWFAGACYVRDNFILSAPAKAPAELLRAGWMVDGAVNNEGFARLTFTKPENEPTAVEVEVYAALKSNTPEHGN